LTAMKNLWLSATFHKYAYESVRPDPSRRREHTAPPQDDRRWSSAAHPGEKGLVYTSVHPDPSRRREHTAPPQDDRRWSSAAHPGEKGLVNTSVRPEEARRAVSKGRRVEGGRAVSGSPVEYIAIRVEPLSKLYRPGPRERTKALRDILADTL